MKLYNIDGTEVNLEEFTGDSVVVCHVKKPMTKEEFDSFCHDNRYIDSIFKTHRIRLIFAPDWIEFMEFKAGKHET